MAEILGLGLTHSPSLIKPDEEKDYSIARSLRNPHLPPELRIPTNWPEPMRIEYGEDEGLESAKKARERLVNGFRKLREELDAFNPDFVVIWGDDQYENFKEDIIPPFCVMAYDEMECQPFATKDGGTRLNVWDEPGDTTFKYSGHRSAARAMVRGMIEQGIDMSYAYQPLHEKGGLGHAILNTLLYLDYDRKGFDYPVVPFLVNCYGSRVVRNRGGAVQYEEEFDPPRSFTQAVHGGGRRGGSGTEGEPLPSGADCVLQLVSCFPDRQESLPISRRALGPGSIRGTARR